MILCTQIFSAQARSWMFTNDLQDERQSCLLHAKKIEKEEALPPYLLQAMVYVESGIKFNRRVGYQTWPWAIQASGKSYFPKTKHEAVSIAKLQLRNGYKNFDMGCLQINWRWHNQAFNSISDALSPEKNIRYAAQFLKRLFKRHKSWEKAVRFYHSSNPKYQDLYEERVFNTKQAVQEYALYKKTNPELKLLTKHAMLKKPQFFKTIYSPKKSAK